MIAPVPALRGALTGIARFAADARDLVFPPHCPGCGGRGEQGAQGWLCASCRRDLPLPESVLCPGCGSAATTDAATFCPSCHGRYARDAVFFAVAYAGSAKELVHRFKYRADFAAGRLLAVLLADRITTALPGGADLLVPVPLHRRRLGARGYNQAAVLAGLLGRRLEITVAVAALARQRATRILAGLDPQQRARELRGAFSVRRPSLVAGRRILLVDDVLTTGATVEGCCRALKECGAAWVGVAVATRVLRAGR